MRNKLLRKKRRRRKRRRSRIMYRKRLKKWIWGKKARRINRWISVSKG
jgi:hypothetical protein